MSDGRAYDGDALPWLEAVENEDGPRAISARKMLVALLLVLLAAASTLPGIAKPPFRLARARIPTPRWT